MRPPPADEAELLGRAWQIAGRTLEEVAAAQGHRTPNLARHKGFIGETVERALGAVAGNAAIPDFPQLGVELKTLPVTAEGKPRESTFVTVTPLQDLSHAWEASRVHHKLARVLFIPVVDGDARRFGVPILWSPSPDQARALAADWAAFGEVVALGDLWRLTARVGAVMQLRPKGASAKETAWVVGEDAEWVAEMRRAVYLRPKFTAAIVAEATRSR